MFSENDFFWMQQTIALARRAGEEGEVPVGALLILDDQVIGEGWNRPILHHDPTAHAEIVALRAAAKKISNYRLTNTTLYVTLEPCMMCAGAIVHARIKRLIFGAHDARSGAVTSVAKILDETFLNHRVAYAGGLLAEQCGMLLSSFFQARRG